MLRVRTKLRDLREGDTVSVRAETFRPEVVTGLPRRLPGEQAVVWTTKTDEGPVRWCSRHMDVEVDLICSSSDELGERLVQSLQGFSPTALAFVARAFCRTCGELECKRHER